MENNENFSPAENTENTVPAEKTEHIPAAENTESIPPAENSESVPAGETPKKSAGKTNWLYRGLMAVFAVIFLVSAGFLADYFIKSARQQNLNNDLSNLVDQNRPTIPPTDPVIPTTPIDPSSPSGPVNPSDPSVPDSSEPSVPDPTEPTKPAITVLPNVLTTIKHPVTGADMQILQEYAPIFQLNSDLVGWVSISGTKINYPVVQTPNDPDYYLYRDFYKNDAKHGTIYAHGQADINRPSENITIYGHRMNDGSMFRTLLNYKDEEFFKTHPYIYFDTLTEHHVYEVVCAYQTQVDYYLGFDFHAFVDCNETRFNRYITKSRQLAWFDSGLEVSYGDKLITLVTCDHAVYTGRWCVVAKRIT